MRRSANPKAVENKQTNAGTANKNGHMVPNVSAGDAIITMLKPMLISVEHEDLTSRHEPVEAAF